MSSFLFSFPDEGGRDASQTASDVELGVQFTEIFIKKSDNVTLLLGLLEVLYTVYRRKFKVVAEFAVSDFCANFFLSNLIPICLTIFVDIRYMYKTSNGLFEFMSNLLLSLEKKKKGFLFSLVLLLCRPVLHISWYINCASDLNRQNRNQI